MTVNSKLLLKTKKFSVVEIFVPARSGEEPLQRQIVEHPGAVTIIPLLADNRVCLIKNQRPAVGKTLIELPAGTIDPDEPPAETAIRELQEETGYTAESWQELPTFYTSPGILSERMYLFVAEGLTAGETAREPGEEIENLIVPWAEAVEMAEQGTIEDAKTLVGLLMWDRLRESSRH